MGLFKKKTPQVIRTSDTGEEREVRTVNGYQVTIRKPSTPASEPKSERRLRYRHEEEATTVP